MVEEAGGRIAVDGEWTVAKKEQTGIEPVTLGPAIPRSTTELLFLFKHSHLLSLIS